MTLTRIAITAAAGVACAMTTGSAGADPTSIAPGAPLEIRCETQATQVAPEAKVSAGAFRVRLDAVAGAPDGAAGTWTPVVRDAAHSGTLAERHREACRAGCPLYIGAESKAFELWVPRRTTLDKTAPGETLTIAVIDSTTLKLKASTFLDQQIASLEQGDCYRTP